MAVFLDLLFTNYKLISVVQISCIQVIYRDFLSPSPVSQRGGQFYNPCGFVTDIDIQIYVFYSKQIKIGIHKLSHSPATQLGFGKISFTW